MFAKALPPSPAPKLSSNNFEPMGNYFIVRQGRRFHYFPVKVEKHPPNAPGAILRFEKTPPVLMEGYVVTQRRVYLVTVQDLLRGIIRTSNEYRLDKEKSGDSSVNSKPASASSAAGAGENQSDAKARTDQTAVSSGSHGVDVFNLLEPGTVSALGLETDDAIDRLVSEQEQALYGLEDSEEER